MDIITGSFTVRRKLISIVSALAVTFTIFSPITTAVAAPNITAATPTKLSSDSEGHVTLLAASADQSSAITIWTNGGQNTLYAKYWNGTEWQETQTVHSPGNVMYEFSVAASPNGKSFAAAYRNHLGHSYVHTATVVEGDLFWVTRVAAFGTGSYSYAPYLTYSGNSNKLMVIARKIQEGNTWDDVVTRSADISDAGAVTWDAGEIFIPNTNSSSHAGAKFFPKVSLSANGGTGIAVFGREVPLTGNEKVQASSYSCDNSMPAVCSWTENIDLTATNSLFRGPEVAISADGTKAIAVWTGGGIYAKNASFDGTNWTWSATAVQITNDGNAGYLSFAADSTATRATAAWSSSSVIYTSTTLDSGSTWSARVNQGTAAAGASANPSVDMSEGTSGRIVVMWGVTGSARAVTGEISDSSISWGAVASFGSTTAFFPNVRISTDGTKALATWERQPSYATSLTFSLPSTDSSLSSLSLSSVTLSPAFATGTTSYTASVGNAVSTVTISAAGTDGSSTIQYRLGTSGSFSSLDSGTSSVSLAVGSNTIEIKVTAGDGTTTTTYTMVVTRAAATSGGPVPSIPDSPITPPTLPLGPNSPELANFSIILPDSNNSRTPGGILEFQLQGLPLDSVASVPTELPTGVAGIEIVGLTIKITPSINFSGRLVIKLPIQIGGRIFIVDIPVQVNPAMTTEVKATPIGRERTNVSWEAVPNAQGYEIKVNGIVRCRTTNSSCAISTLLGPNSVVEVISLGGDKTTSQATGGNYSPAQFIPVLNVFFTAGSAVITKAERRKIVEFAKLVQSRGFTEVRLDGYLESLASSGVSPALSRQRTKATSQILKKFISVKIKTISISSQDGPGKVAKTGRVQGLIR